MLRAVTTTMFFLVALFAAVNFYTDGAPFTPPAAQTALTLVGN